MYVNFSQLTGDESGEGETRIDLRHIHQMLYMCFIVFSREKGEESANPSK